MQLRFDKVGANRGAEHPYSAQGGVEQDRPGQPTNVAPLRHQTNHRDQDPFNKASDSDFPESGQNPEYSMERQEKNQLKQDTKAGVKEITPDVINPEAVLDDQDPGMSQKQNQNDEKDDPLAA